jgi:hypothetical protein
MDDSAAKNDLERRIRERAYRIWVDEGKPTGKSEDHLLQAEQELEEEAAVKSGTEDLNMQNPAPAAPNRE